MPTAVQLKKLAKEAGVKNFGRMTKEQLEASLGSSTPKSPPKVKKGDFKKNIFDKTTAELRVLAKDKGIKLYYSKSKEQLLKELGVGLKVIKKKAPPAPPAAAPVVKKVVCAHIKREIENFKDARFNELYQTWKPAYEKFIQSQKQLVNDRKRKRHYREYVLGRRYMKLNEATGQYERSEIHTNQGAVVSTPPQFEEPFTPAEIMSVDDDDFKIIWKRDVENAVAKVCKGRDDGSWKTDTEFKEVLYLEMRRGGAVRREHLDIWNKYKDKESQAEMDRDAEDRIRNPGIRRTHAEWQALGVI